MARGGTRIVNGDINCKRQGGITIDAIDFNSPVKIKRSGSFAYSGTAEFVHFGEWKPDDFENEYRRDLKAMLDAKLAGEQIARPEPVAETPVVDLMEALRRSVADAQGRKGGAGSKKTKAASKSNGSSGGSRRKTSARKSA